MDKQAQRNILAISLKCSKLGRQTESVCVLFKLFIATYLIHGNNLPVYNQVHGQQSHGSETANITVVELQLELYLTGPSATAVH